MDLTGLDEIEARLDSGAHVPEAAIRDLIARVRQAERERDEARVIAKGLTDTARMIAREYGP